MATSSQYAGYLAPSSAPPYDNDLEDIFQAVLSAITGVQGNLVRPRWQPESGNTPDVDIDWIAFGMTVTERQWNAYQIWDADLNAYTVSGTETIQVHCSFYGPHNQELRRRWEDGLQIDQNLEALRAQKVKFVGMLDAVNVPALFKNQWRDRVDMKAVFQRWATRIYPITTLLSAGVDLDNEHYVTHIDVTPPSP